MKKYLVLCIFSFLCLAVYAQDSTLTTDSQEKGKIVPISNATGEEIKLTVPDETETKEIIQTDNNLINNETPKQESVVVPLNKTDAPILKEKRRFVPFWSKKIKDDIKPVQLTSPTEEEKGQIIENPTQQIKDDTAQINLETIDPAQKGQFVETHTLHAKDDTKQVQSITPTEEKGQIIENPTKEIKDDTQPINVEVSTPTEKGQFIETRTHQIKDDIKPAQSITPEGKKGRFIETRTEQIKDDTKPAQLTPPEPEEKGQFIENQTEKVKDDTNTDKNFTTPYLPKEKGVILPIKPERLKK